MSTVIAFHVEGTQGHFRLTSLMDTVVPRVGEEVDARKALGAGMEGPAPFVVERISHEITRNAEDKFEWIIHVFGRPTQEPGMLTYMREQVEGRQ